MKEELVTGSSTTYGTVFGQVDKPFYYKFGVRIPLNGLGIILTQQYISADFDVPQSSASGAKPESGRIVIDINKPNIPSSPGYIYLRIFDYKAGKLIPIPIYVAPILFKVTKDCSGVVYLKNGRTP